MRWEVEFTAVFGAWWDSLDEEEQESVDASVQLLIELGPALPYPHSSDVKGARHGNMRELRVQHLEGIGEEKEKIMTKTGARPYSELRAKMSPESRARAQRRAKKMLAEMPLYELRHAHEMSQKHLAEILGINQASVSKLERRADMYISTLRSFIEAMGGQLEIKAVFPDGAVSIRQIKELKKESAIAKKPRLAS